jgi:hypothetical protein
MGGSCCIGGDYGTERPRQMTVIIFPDGAKINVGWTRIPVIFEEILFHQIKYQVSNVVHEVGKDLEQKIYIELVAI